MPQITQPHFIEHAQAIRNLLHLTKENDRFTHSHIQNFMHILPPVTNVQNLLLEPCALTLFANQLNVGQKLHLYGDRAVSLANVTTATG